MPNLPAFCDNCGTMFPSGFFVDDCVNITLSGNRSGPCPACGGMGSIPDGVFNVLGGVIQIIDAPRKTAEQLSRFVKVLNEAAKKNYTREQVEEHIEREAPELASIGYWLPKTPDQLYAFLALLIAVLSFAHSIKDSGEEVSDDPQVVIQQTINNYYGQQSIGCEQQQSRGTQVDRKLFDKKIGRNEPCPCGSGLKFKKCCLNNL